MSHFLVFGTSGQLGSELRGLAQERDLDLSAIGREVADITDSDAVARTIDAHRPKVVINAAAYTAVDRAESEPELASRVNGYAPGMIAGHCARAGIPFIHVSTDYVFDGTKIGAYVESDPIAPLGAYGRSKAQGESNVRDALDQHVIVRTAWVYGRFGHNFLKTMLRLAAERDRLTIVADQRGCPTATADLAAGIIAAAEKAADGTARWGTYHLAGTGATTWHGFASEIIRHAAGHTGRRPKVVPITTAEFPTPARRPANSELASDAFAAEFGYRSAPWPNRVTEIVDTLLFAPAN